MKVHYNDPSGLAPECDPVKVRMQYDMKPMNLRPDAFGITRAHVADFVPWSPGYEYRYVTPDEIRRYERHGLPPPFSRANWLAMEDEKRRLRNRREVERQVEAMSLRDFVENSRGLRAELQGSGLAGPARRSPSPWRPRRRPAPFRFGPPE